MKNNAIGFIQKYAELTKKAENLNLTIKINRSNTCYQVKGLDSNGAVLFTTLNDLDNFLCGYSHGKKSKDRMKENNDNSKVQFSWI